jgi:hypothetical protein
VTTGQIYWGAVPFVVIQMVMVAIVIAFPGLVTGNLEKNTGDPSKVQFFAPTESEPAPEEAPPDFGAPAGKAAPGKKEPPENRKADELENLFRK